MALIHFLLGATNVSTIEKNLIPGAKTLLSDTVFQYCNEVTTCTTARNVRIWRILPVKVTGRSAENILRISGMTDRLLSATGIASSIVLPSGGWSIRHRFSSTMREITIAPG